MLLTLIAVPCILLAKLLMPEELFKAIINGDSIGQTAHDLVLLMGEDLIVPLESHQVFEKSPTFICVEINL